MLYKGTHELFFLSFALLMTPTSNEFCLLKTLTLISSTNKLLWKQFLLDVGTSVVDTISSCARNAIENDHLTYRASWLQDKWFRSLADRGTSADQKAFIILQHRKQIQHLIASCLQYIERHETKTTNRRT